MPDKLLTAREACNLLGISEEKLEGLVQKGDLPAYRIGGEFLRFRKEQIEAIRDEVGTKSASRAAKSAGEGCVIAPADTAYQKSWTDSFFDFIYFYDFYIIAGVIMLVILWFIFR